VCEWGIVYGFGVLHGGELRACKKCGAKGLCGPARQGENLNDECGTGDCAGKCNSAGECEYPALREGADGCDTSCGGDSTVEIVHRCATDRDECLVSADTRACGVCKRCGAKGGKSCEAVADDSNPHGDCGSHATCAGKCVSGVCNFSAVGTSVGCATTCNGGQVDEKFCTGDGRCNTTAARQTPCAPFKCESIDGVKDTCYKGCDADQSQCVAGSACDRRLAHADGSGKCLAVADVTPAADDTALGSALTSGATYIRLTGASYGAVPTIASGSVMLIGTPGTTQIDPTSAGAPAVQVDGAASQPKAELTIQGVTLIGATGATGHGIYCTKALSAPAPSVTVVESVIRDNGGAGVFGSNCDVTVRRTKVHNNSAGGLWLSQGQYTITNCLITKNDGIGGVLLATPQPAGSTSFEHNTVYDNDSAGTYSGVECSGGNSTLTNSIVSGNDKQETNCPTTTSNTSENATGAGSCQMTAPLTDQIPIAKPTPPDCVGQGSTTTLTLDHDNRPRTQGGDSDLGAFEVQ
jgi:hypothetical protein